MLRLVTAVAVAGLLMAGCGGEDSSPEAGSPVEGKRAGKLTMLWTDDVDNIDPGITYYQMGYMVAYATQRPLYSHRPDDGERAVPDLAESDPQVSEDGRTVTVTIRKGVRFSAPVNREVKAADVKYAIERGFFKTVNNGYAAHTSATSWALGRVPSRAGRSRASRRPTTARSSSASRAGAAACWPAPWRSR